VPIARFAKFTAALMNPEFEPLVAPLRLSQLPLVTDADQFSVPPPALLIETVWLPGLLPPCAPEKLSELVLNPIEAPPDVTVRLTETDTVEGLALGIDIEICPE
jgi:hypothetical protein